MSQVPERSMDTDNDDVQGADQRQAFLTLAAGHSPRAEVIPYSQTNAAHSMLFVRHLEIDARIGVYHHEKDRIQRILLDIEFGMNSELACHTDRLSDAIDYSKVVERVRDIALERHYELVEALAESMALLLRRDFGLPWIRLSLAKLEPFPGAQVGIVIERGRRG